MPYTGIKDNNLPSYIKKLPSRIQTQWIAIFNETFRKNGEATAFTVANGWLKKKIVGKIEAVTNSTEEDITLYTLKFDLPEQGLVINSEDGNDYIDLILTDIGELNGGKSFDEAFLYEIAERINKEGIIGDFDHEQFKTLVKSGLGPEAIVSALKGKKGIARAVKAIVEKGKLWVRAQIDKRYRKRILNSKGVSIEGFFRRKSETNKYVDGPVLGFSFIENQIPVNPRAGVVM